MGRPSSRLATLARWTAALALLAGCAWYVVARTDHEALRSALSRADYGLVTLTAAGHLFLLLPLEAWRWQLMLAPISRLPLRVLFPYKVAGCAAANVLPARAGQALRVLLMRRHGVAVAGGVGVMVLEEIFNTAMLASLSVPLLFTLPLSVELRAALSLVATGSLLGGAVAIWLASSSRPRGPRFVQRLAEGLAMMRNPRAALAVLALSAVVWLLDVGQIALIMHATGVAPTYSKAALVLLFVNLAMAVPITPGQLGLFEASAAAACVSVGASPEQGLTIGVLYHMMQVIPETLFGGAVLAQTALAGNGRQRA
jgi:uncharacterized membrane protein YbhN (UPF0104 family)